jgi:hypothetical protein
MEYQTQFRHPSKVTQEWVKPMERLPGILQEDSSASVALEMKRRLCGGKA